MGEESQLLQPTTHEGQLLRTCVHRTEYLAPDLLLKISDTAGSGGNQSPALEKIRIFYGQDLLLQGRRNRIKETKNVQ